MFNIGPQELLVILLVALVIVGPQRLPELARTIGRWVHELRRAQEEVTRTIQLGLDEAEPTKPTFPKPGVAEPATRREPEGADESGEGASAEETEEGVADVARTLGRGLAEIRRARRELQRTFRVDLSEDPAPSRRPSPSPAPPPQGSDPARTEPRAGEG